MAVWMLQQNSRGGIYFIAFTCYDGKSLFELTSVYDVDYKWFDYLVGKEASVVGYFSMPNHFHALLHLSPAFKTVNTVVSNSKRLLAYETIKRLEVQKADCYCTRLLKPKNGGAVYEHAEVWVKQFRS
jgi:hypothetical protein